MTRLSLRPRAIAGLSFAGEKDRARIEKALAVLDQGSLPLHTKKLGGVPNGYRIRVGRWRILFILQDGEVDVADIFLKKGRGDYRKRLR